MASGGPTSVVTLDAVRDQLKLMGHQVPDEVITAFLDEAGFSSGFSQAQQTARERQPYQASFDFAQTQAAGRPRTPSPRRDTARLASSRRSLQIKTPPQPPVGATKNGNLKGAPPYRLGGGASPTGHSDKSCSSCLSDYEAAGSALEVHGGVRDQHHRPNLPSGSRHEGIKRDIVQENDENGSCASSAQSCRLARAAERRASQRTHNRATQAMSMSGGSCMSLCQHGCTASHADTDDQCSEKCSCCMRKDGQGTSMHSTQTTPSLDGDSTPRLRSRSRSAGTLHVPVTRRVLRLPPTSLVPPLNVAMRRPIIDRVARYREMQQTWESDPFLKSGGDASSQRRPRQGFREAFQSLHLLEAAARTHMPATARLSNR